MFLTQAICNKTNRQVTSENIWAILLSAWMFLLRGSIVMERKPKRMPKLVSTTLSIYMIINASCSFAQGSDEGLKFNVGQNIYYDSNIYRLADGISAPAGERSDWVGITGFGLSFDKTYGRQKVFAEMGIDRTYHAVHKSLDYTGGNAALRWDWALGRQWSGQLGHEQREALAGFDEFIGATQSVNIFRKSMASADYWWRPDWAVGGGVMRLSSRFRDNARPESEYDADVVDLNLAYRPVSGNRVMLSMRNTDGRYANRPAVAGSMRDYEQREVRLGAEWQATGKLRLTGYVGRTQREYAFASNRDFEGATGRLALTWAATGKTTVDLSLRREIGAEEDVVANYAVTEAINLRPVWAITDKLAFGTEFELRRRDFGGNAGDPAFAGTPVAGEERSYLYGLSLNYRPLRSTTVSLGLARRIRTAGDPLREFDADTARISARMAF